LDESAKREFEATADDKKRAVIVQEYLLANIDACLQSSWLQWELFLRIHRDHRDPIVRTYARILVRYHQRKR
jgi:hypothetical protein